MEVRSETISMYLLGAMVILMIGFFAFAIAVLVRLCIHRGALGPPPENFVVLPTYLRDRVTQVESSTELRNIRPRSMFPFPKPTSPLASSPGVSHLSHIPRINVAAIDIEKEPDREVRAFFKEQLRISKLPAFVQDDCGDGSEFPDIPFADTGSGSNSTALYPYANNSREVSANRQSLGLKEQAFNEWLKVDTTHTKLHEAREWLLTKKNSECLKVTTEGQAACEELLQEIAEFLVIAHPTQYKLKTVFGHKQIRNELTKEEYSLVRPFDCHPLEVCARLVNEDFNILAKGEFTQQYYLQASATLAPAGICTGNLIGKSLAQIRQQEVYQWDDLAEIAPLPLLAPLTRSSFYIQTQPDTRSLADLLFIESNKNFFPGTVQHLFPSHILVRRETQTFRRLGSGAVVMSVRTELKRLMELNEAEKKELLDEMEKWSKDVARWKGKGLWEGEVVEFCGGKLSKEDELEDESDDEDEKMEKK